MIVKLKALGPIHIGSGEEISPMDYYVNDKFTRINMNGLFNDPNFAPIMEKFIEAAGSQRYIGEHVPTKLLEEHPLYRLPIRGYAKEYLETNQTVIKAFIKSGARVYIPGSSLKGCILSALLWYVLRNARHRDQQEIESLLNGSGKFNDLLNIGFKLMIHSRDDRSFRSMRFARWLDVGDSNFKDANQVLEISLVRIQGAKTGQEQPILYETLRTGVEFELKISSQNLNFSENQVLDICNQFYRRVLKNEPSKNIQPTANLLRLGQGSSAFATSLLILAEDLNLSYYKVTPPTTRKRIDEHFAMGWVELSECSN